MAVDKLRMPVSGRSLGGYKNRSRRHIKKLIYKAACTHIHSKTLQEHL